MTFESLLDRAITAAPFGVLVYLVKRQADERRDLIRSLELEREAFRGDRRELLNRITHPNLMPTGSQPIGGTRPVDATRASDARHRAMALVGRAAPPAVPSPMTDEG